MIPDNLIIEFLRVYQLPLVFLGAFFFGETVVISSAFLAAQGILSLFYVILLTFLGTIFSDSLWFYFGNYIFWKKQYFTKNRKYDQILKQINKITGKRPFLSLLFIKFLYGTRVLTIVYLSSRRLKFSSFLLFDTLGTILWLIVILPIGWFAGKGISNIILIFNRIEYLLISLLIFILIFRLITLWITKRIIK